MDSIGSYMSSKNDHQILKSIALIAVLAFFLGVIMYLIKMVERDLEKKRTDKNKNVLLPWWYNWIVGPLLYMISIILGSLILALAVRMRVI